MNWFLGLPLELRLGVVFIAGVLIGTQVNRGIFRLAWHPKKIGPWSPPDEQAPPRKWFDRLPLFGWVTLRRESPLHGDTFWLRPLMIELAMGIGLALLYWWEVELGELTPRAVGGDWAPPVPLPPDNIVWLHAQFFVQAILIALMAVASFIDIDEKLIPDEITVNGALLGLLLAALLPVSRLPEWDAFTRAMPPATWNEQTLLLFNSPNPWPQRFNGPPGLAIGLGSFAAWWLAIVPWRWAPRAGLVRAIRYAAVSLKRRVWPRRGRPHEGTRRYLAILLLGVVAVSLVWWLQTALADAWRPRICVLVGLAAFLFWWVAIIPFTWTTRAGGVRAVRYALVSLKRRVWPRRDRPHEGTREYVAVLVIGLAAFALLWMFHRHLGTVQWPSLLSALVGMAAGGAIIWAVRLIGGKALGKEAMGFGDVTLVAMIGAFLGWQPCLILFFIAPFIGVVIALLNWIFTRRPEIWYGPFLCAGALLTIVYWATLWEQYGRRLFGLGDGLFVPALVVVLMTMMGAMLTIWRFIKERLIFRDE